VYAIRTARDKDGVAAVKGRIVNESGRVHAGGPCVFGADERGTQIVLTVMRFDPAVRSAAIIAFLPTALAALEGMLLECCPVDRSREPAGISSMDWSVASCCKDGVPDVIFDRGGNGNDGRIFIFSEKPAVVANNIIICSNRM
jgi:hydroxymethylpyrimidine/phosphomethylpyrimidine kinase